MAARRLDATQDALRDLTDVIVSMTPDQLEDMMRTLPEQDVMLVERVMAEHLQAGWRGHPAAMAEHLNPSGFRMWRHTELLSKKFADAVAGRDKRQLWALPGRYGKTLMLRWGLVWALDRRPSARSIYVTYGDDLALETGAAVRDLLRFHHKELRAQLLAERGKMDRWATVDGGGLLAGGIRTGITGFGVTDGGVLVVDDPFKGWQEAHRQTERDDIYSRYKGTLRNRLDDENAAIIVVHHRMHEEDLVGRLHGEAEDGTGDPFTLTAIPAIAPDPAVMVAAGKIPRPDPLGREPGEVIEPGMFTVEEVRSRHQGMGSSYLIAALEQQDPQPPEGKEILREWFVLAGPGEMPTHPEAAISSWDLKLKDREQGDFVVGQVWWRSAGAYWLMDQIRGQFDHATTANAIALLSVRNPHVPTHWVEAAGAAPEIVTELRRPIHGYDVSAAMATRLGMSIEEQRLVSDVRRRGMSGLAFNAVKGDKSVRARAFIAPLAESGLVRLRADAPWLAVLLDELAEFPTGTHDDQVDAMSQALKRLGRGGATAKAATVSRAAGRPGSQRRRSVRRGR